MKTGIVFKVYSAVGIWLIWFFGAIACYGRVEMAAKLRAHGSWQRGCLAVYVFVLLFMVIGLTLGSGVWMFGGLACWGCAVFGWFYYYSKSNNAKCLKTDSANMRSYIGGERQGKVVLVRVDCSCPLPSGRDTTESSLE